MPHEASREQQIAIAKKVQADAGWGAWPACSRSWGCVSAWPSGLLDPTAIRELARQLGLRPTKQRGQNFVTDANTVRRIVAAAGVAEDDVVLEVGPGLGSLTLGLLQAARQRDRDRDR